VKREASSVKRARLKTDHKRGALHDIRDTPSQMAPIKKASVKKNRLRGAIAQFCEIRNHNIVWFNPDKGGTIRNNIECSSMQFYKRFRLFEHSYFGFVSNLGIRASVLPKDN
jgi:hypothetical protein